jgi:hypothetical protein
MTDLDEFIAFGEKFGIIDSGPKEYEVDAYDEELCSGAFLVGKKLTRLEIGRCQNYMFDQGKLVGLRDTEYGSFSILCDDIRVPYMKCTACGADCIAEYHYKRRKEKTPEDLICYRCRPKVGNGVPNSYCLAVNA